MVMASIGGQQHSPCGGHGGLGDGVHPCSVDSRHSSPPIYGRWFKVLGFGYKVLRRPCVQGSEAVDLFWLKVLRFGGNTGIDLGTGLMQILLILEEIIGLTTKNGNGLASSISSSKCAYIAGCVVVLYDVHSGTQSHLMAPNRVPKPLSCVALSRDASIVVAGEVFQSGHQPSVLVWDCATLALISELKCHQYGVACMALSPDGKHLVSVGSPRDGYICLWDWRNKILAAKVKASSVSSPIASVNFSLDKKSIVTAEKNQLKFWKVRWSPGTRAVTRSVSVTMQRKVNLGQHEESSFVAVTSLNWTSSIFTKHSQAGTLCMVYSDSSVINSVELEEVAMKVEKCFALSTSTSLVACACNNGLVKLFDTSSLKYAGVLSYVEAKTDDRQVKPQSWPTLPDAIALVVYDDHSLYVWNIHDIHKATRCCVLVSHSGCIWDIKNVPCENMHDPSLSCVAKGCSGGLSFATCSTDGNLRLWDFALQSASSENCLPVDDSSNGATCLVSAGIFERDSVAKGITSPGFRSMAVSSDGKHLAAGDCQGDIHIFNLYTSDYIHIQEAHGAEILSLSFNVAGKNDLVSTETSESRRFLASGGRDGKIHIFDVDRNFNLVGSIDYHSCAVTVVKVSRSGREILSCGADRSLVLHSVDMSDTECKISCLHRIATSGTIYDVAVDHTADVAFTMSQDKKINAFDVKSGKLIRWFQHDGDLGDPMKVTTDGSRSYLACSYSNRCICMFDYITGEIVAQATGHSDVITGIIFLPDCKHLVSVGTDGCIFVWKLPAALSSRMLQRTNDAFQFLPDTVNQPMTFTQMIKSDLVVDHQQNGYSKEASGNGNLRQTCGQVLIHGADNKEFTFSISRLPKWARHQVVNNSLSAKIDSDSSKVGSPQDYTCLESKSSSSDALEAGQVPGTLSRCSSDMDSSQVYPSPQESYSWAPDNRWLTIHTVCMDMLDSPKTCDMKGMNAQGSAKGNICKSQGLLMETTHSNKRIKLSSLDPSTNNPTVPPNPQHIEQVNFQDALFEDYKSNASRKDSQENEIFEMNYGNFSAELKTDNRVKSSTRNSYVSRFLVRREILEGRKRSLCAHAQDSIVGSPRKRTSSNVLPMMSSISLLEDAENAPPSSPSQITEMPSNSGDQVSLDDDKVGVVEIARLCEKALDNLEAEAENTLLSFCKLAAVNNGEEKSRDFEARLFAKAADRLPLIGSKIQAIAKLLKLAGNSERIKQSTEKVD
ncbi:mitogen-activated protein kinase-binding protein 1 [Phtheirospermum japonicum]|uniref:Mitogen-activated protein kinase-binding protein 1 n=1 Tax=Phtheirospermum japonicum TaxID=374723 RepID=A0A830BNY0_9LAMI|nr:mitogen-activated protein kinase-binding protein 1 [Phtheirospermum japonicum]